MSLYGSIPWGTNHKNDWEPHKIHTTNIHICCKNTVNTVNICFQHFPTMKPSVFVEASNVGGKRDWFVSSAGVSRKSRHNASVTFRKC